MVFHFPFFRTSFPSSSLLAQDIQDIDIKKKSLLRPFLKQITLVEDQQGVANEELMKCGEEKPFNSLVEVLAIIRDGMHNCVN